MSLKNIKGKDFIVFFIMLTLLSLTIKTNKHTLNAKKPTPEKYVCKIENKSLLHKAMSKLFLLDIEQTNLTQLAEQMYVATPSESNERANRRSQLSSRGLPSLGMNSDRGFIWPVEGPRAIGSPFGDRDGKFHLGVDLVGKIGMPIIAAKSGKVIFSGERPEYGKCVIISHGNGLRTLYAHASELEVNTGDMVQAGNEIAKIGMTGNATGPHLHFEVRVNGEAKNPVDFLN